MKNLSNTVPVIINYRLSLKFEEKMISKKFIVYAQLRCCPRD
jgi:hypothetical protein